MVHTLYCRQLITVVEFCILEMHRALQISRKIMVIRQKAEGDETVLIIDRTKSYRRSHLFIDVKLLARTNSS